jgi:O-antigen ligase
MKQSLLQWSPLVLVWSCLMLLPASRLSEGPVIIMAILGIYLAFRNGRSFFWSGTSRDFTLIFLLFWLPVLFSIPGATNPGKALVVLATFPRLYFAGLFIIYALADTLARERFLRLCAWGLLFWVGDSLLQVFRGVDLFGYTYTEGVRLSGIFGRYPLKLGWCMALFSPFLLIYARRNWNPLIQIGVFAGVLTIVLLSFSRGGWIAFAVILAGYGLFTYREHGKFFLRSAAAIIIGGIVGLSTVYAFSPGFAATVERTSLVFRGDAESINHAITFRVPIWRTAARMFLENPLNGVGARGFRYAYVDHAATKDLFVEPWADEAGAAHAHQLLLDIASETGAIGLVGWLAAMGLLIQLWRRADGLQKTRMLPYGLALLAAFFPINTHFALYSSVWSLVLFWLMALYCATAKESALVPAAGRLQSSPPEESMPSPT